MTHGQNRLPLFTLTLLLTLVTGLGARAEVVTVSTDPAKGLVAAPKQAPVSAASGYFDAANTAPCLTPDERQAIQARLAASVADLRARGLLPGFPERTDKTAGVLLNWPVVVPAAHVTDPGVHGISGFVDENPAFPDQLLDYNCGSRTYDLSSGYNHKGTDIFSWPFGWNKMDDGDAEVVAGADGVIVGKDDGNYDRSCGFGGGNWNAVYVQHADGSIAWYGHMKTWSLTGKGIGESVAAGEYLGIVGSSGNSTGPHLHLELYDAQNNLIDPWLGPCNGMNPDSWWANQPPYYDSAINALRTHAAPPDWGVCPDPEITNEEDRFMPGELVYFATYYRDQLEGQTSIYQIRRPGGLVWQSWTAALTVPHYAASWWYWSWYLPADAETGVWTFRVTYNGQVVDHPFAVGDISGTPEVVRADGPRLHEPRPNPFNPRTTLAFDLPARMVVSLRVYDLAGRLVDVVLDEETAARGRNELVWRGRDLEGQAVPAGVYFYRLDAGAHSLTGRMTLVK